MTNDVAIGGLCCSISLIRLQLFFDRSPLPPPSFCGFQVILSQHSKIIYSKNKRLGATVHNDTGCWIRKVQKHNKSYTGLNLHLNQRNSNPKSELTDIYRIRKFMKPKLMPSRERPLFIP